MVGSFSYSIPSHSLDGRGLAGNAICFSRIAMKTLCLIACLAVLAIFAARAQAPAANQADEQLLQLVKEVQDQQAQIVSNQKKIDGKLADVAEAIRTARIFASRGR
jgi:hypothetical protein